MSDPADQANDIIERVLSRQLAAATAPIAVGVPGECTNCGEDSPRLVGGRCARCRDGRR